MKKALVVVSFGTSYEDVLEKNIVPVEQALKNAFPSYEFYRGFTSRFIVKKLNNCGLDVKTEVEVVKALIEQGYEEILIQPTHIIPGFEYEKIQALKDLSNAVKIGFPLLTDESDFAILGNILRDVYQLNDLQTPFVFMAHGTEHKANELYIKFGEYLNKEYPQVYMAGVEGDQDFEGVLETLTSKGAQGIAFAPLMIVAGDHAQNDMAGDEEDSWKSLAEEKSLKVSVHMQGLGAYEGVQALFVEKAKKLI